MRVAGTRSRVTYAGGSPADPPAALTMTALDAPLVVSVRYREPKLGTGPSPDLFTLTLPAGVKIQRLRCPPRRGVIRFYALSRRSRRARSLTLRTSAKVNLVLEVLGKRGDGYHELSTVLQAVDVFDRLVLEEDEALTLRTSDPALPTDEANLVVKAARLLMEAAGGNRGARITLEKRIPVAAGLGDRKSTRLNPS